MQPFNPHSDLSKRDQPLEPADILGWILVAANLLLVATITFS
jgi:hypothetical protein